VRAGPRFVADSQLVLTLALLVLLALFILYPLGQVLSVALWGESGVTLVHILAFFERPLFREALVNTLVSGVAAVAFGSVLALPLAHFSVRYAFPGKQLLHVLGILPLVIPPFVGAVALQLLLGRSGTVNLLLLDYFGITIPFMEGLTGVILVQTLHYFPFIMLNTAASLAKVDPSLEEAAQNLGSRGFRLFRRITWPLVMPGYVAGCLLTSSG